MAIVDGTLWLQALNAMVCGLFLLVTFALVATRQIQACLRMFVLLSVLLGLSALLLSGIFATWHLVVVAGVDIASKAIAIPWILRRGLPSQSLARREVTQVLNVPTALLIALGLAIIAFIACLPLIRDAAGNPLGVNLPVGAAGLLVGGFTAAVRREAVPLFLGLLAMENSAFLAGIGVAPEMPLLAEISIALDVVILVIVVGVLTATVHERFGTTAVGDMTTLREQGR